MNMTQNEDWTTELPHGVTLQIFNGEELIFSSGGKWLMPIFELEQFMETYTGAADDLRAHDTAIGKAAAVMMIRLGVKHIHANIGSALAEQYIQNLNDGLIQYVNRDEKLCACSEKIEFVYDIKVPKLLCQTEDQLEQMTDSDAMYRILRQRANLVRGAAVDVEHLSCHYSSLHDFSFSLPAGGNLLIIGGNGAGKTTLLRFLSGNLLPEGGKILIGGKTLNELEPRTVCYVPQQQDSVMFPLSVEEVVGLGIPKSEKQHAKIIAAALKRMGCENLSGRSFSTLSGGEKQKVSIARCIAQNAKILLLDEPTSALDESSRQAVTQILKSLSVKEIPTIITVTHDMVFAKELGWQSLVIGDAA